MYLNCFYMYIYMQDKWKLIFVFQTFCQFVVMDLSIEQNKTIDKIFTNSWLTDVIYGNAPST